MTISATAVKEIFEGNNETSVFPLPFPVLQARHIGASILGPNDNPTPLEMGSGFTVTITNRQAYLTLLGGALPQGKKLLVERILPLVQEVRLNNQGGFYPSVVEEQLDYMTMVDQQLQEHINSLPDSREIVRQTDPRLSDDRTPTSHSDSHKSGGTDAIKPTDIGALPTAPNDGYKYLAMGNGFVKYVPSEGGGTLDHSDLTEESRASPNQHPQSAIENLVSDLSGKAHVSHIHALATESDDGFMSAGDKAKLDGLEMVSGGFITGEIRFLPFRAGELPNGWYFTNGDSFPLASDQGLALNTLSDNYKMDWGIIVTGANINLPNLFHSDGRGYFLRAGANPGFVQNDAIKNMTGTTGGTYVLSNTNLSAGAGVMTIQNITSVPLTYTGGNAYWNQITFDASRQVPTASENRPVNITMTPAIFLGV